MIALERDAGVCEVRLAREAMATRFELVLYGPDAARLRAAGEEALAEVTRLHQQLSFYDRASDVSWINAHAAKIAVAVEPRLFMLLQRCRELSLATDGAFDVTVAPLMRAWRFTSDRGAVPDRRTLAAALASVGFAHLELDAHMSTVRFRRPGMSIDLGAVGKGHAVDAAMAVLRQHGVTDAIVHGGTSSIHANGHPPESDAWRVGWAPPGAARRIFTLRDCALSVSASHGKTFVSEGREYGHVIVPRSGHPCAGARAAVVIGPGSLECDALSTAALVLGDGALPALKTRFPEYAVTVA